MSNRIFVDLPASMTFVRALAFDLNPQSTGDRAANTATPGASYAGIRAARLFGVLTALAACSAEVPEAPSKDGASAPASAATVPARWTGEVTGGYTGNRISFVVADGGSRLEDITFEGHWDCADGIDQTTLGPTGSHPVVGGAIRVDAVEPPDGGATAQRFTMDGAISGTAASGTLRISINALGCDTRVLRWSAAPR